jgi:hypothetical protein
VFGAGSASVESGFYEHRQLLIRRLRRAGRESELCDC